MNVNGVSKEMLVAGEEIIDDKAITIEGSPH